MFRHTMKEKDLRVEENKTKKKYWKMTTEKSEITNTLNFQYMHQVSNNLFQHYSNFNCSLIFSLFKAQLF